MFQVNFSNRAIAELNKLGKLEQLEIMEALGAVTAKRLAEDAAEIGRFDRGGRTLYRLRVDDWRVYFGADGERLQVEFLLHKRSIADFVVLVQTARGRRGGNRAAQILPRLPRQSHEVKSGN